jgi:hypothetical protein
MKNDVGRDALAVEEADRIIMLYVSNANWFFWLVLLVGSF